LDAVGECLQSKYQLYFHIFGKVLLIGRKTQLGFKIQSYESTRPLPALQCHL